MSIRMTSLVAAAAVLGAIAAMPGAPAQAAEAAQLVTNGPQVDRGDVGSGWSARQDNIESRRYDRLVQASPGFRAARMRKECGPIGDPQLHASCIASFNRYEPAPTGYGSSAGARHYRNRYGR